VTVTGVPAAADGQEIGFSSAGQDWTVTWCRPEPVPGEQPHGANTFCVTGDGGIVLINHRQLTVASRVPAKHVSAPDKCL
jgi:hypothetical protein